MKHLIISTVALIISFSNYASNVQHTSSREYRIKFNYDECYQRSYRFLGVGRLMCTFNYQFEGKEVLNGTIAVFPSKPHHTKMINEQSLNYLTCNIKVKAKKEYMRLRVDYIFGPTLTGLNGFSHWACDKHYLKVLKMNSNTMLYVHLKFKNNDKCTYPCKSTDNLR